MVLSVIASENIVGGWLSESGNGSSAKRPLICARSRLLANTGGRVAEKDAMDGISTIDEVNGCEKTYHLLAVRFDRSLKRDLTHLQVSMILDEFLAKVV